MHGPKKQNLESLPEISFRGRHSESLTVALPNIAIFLRAIYWNVAGITLIP